MAYWQAVDRQYVTAYPGHGRVVEYLMARQKESEAKMADTDPNPDLLAKRRTNLGESVYQMQQNLGAAIRAKDKALRDWVSARVNDPNHRHTVAAAALDTMTERFRSYIAQMEKQQDELLGGSFPLTKQRDDALNSINRHAGDFMLGLIATAKRREIDEGKDAYLAAARRLDAEALDRKAAAAAIVFYSHLIETVTALRAEMDRYVERMESLRARFEKAERHAVQEPADVNGEVLFNPGRRETDPNTGIERYVGGDIDERYAHLCRQRAGPGQSRRQQPGRGHLGYAGNPQRHLGDARRRFAAPERGHLRPRAGRLPARRRGKRLDKFYRQVRDGHGPDDPDPAAGGVAVPAVPALAGERPELHPQHEQGADHCRRPARGSAAHRKRAAVFSP